jgi:deoxyadenosine/deoxycytidine kinase
MASESESPAIHRNERQIQPETGRRPPSLVGVVGPIGAGKSTLAAGLAAALGFQLFVERVDDNPFFTRFAGDPPTWVFRSQLAFMMNAVSDAIEARHRGDAVIERPVQEMYGIFVRDQMRNKLISEEEEALLRQLVEIGDRAGARPDLLIAVTAPPDLLYGRISSRARPGEEHYSLEYIERLAGSYDSWLSSCPVPFIGIDSGTRDIRDPPTVKDFAALVEEELSGLARP